MFLLASLFSFHYSYAQERFNIRYDSGFPNTLLFGVVEVDGGYFCSGILGDTISNGSGTPTLYAKFDYNGELLWQKDFGGNGGEEPLKCRVLSSQNSDLQYLNDSTLIHSGVTYDNEWVRQGYIMKVNLEGDTLEMIRFYSPNYGQEFPYNSITTTRCKVNTEGNILVSSSYLNLGTGNDVVIHKLTPEGELLWPYYYIHDQEFDIIYTIVPTADGGAISSAYDILEFGVSGRTYYFKYNSNGILEWDFYFGEEYNIGGGTDIILDDGFLVCSTQQRDFDSPNGWAPLILKINTIGGLEWKTKIFENNYSIDHRHRKILKTIDGNYVSGGIHGIDLVDEAAVSSAFLAKVNANDGELMWTRKYKYFDLGNDIHRLHDLKTTSDGGFIFCGEANGTDEDNPDVTGPNQQGWLVKLDEYGCLVEGCQLSDNIIPKEGDDSTEYFKAGPIPSGQFLNIYQSQKSSPLATYQLLDQTGKVLESFSAMNKGTTLMLDVYKYQPGMYLLYLSHGNKLLQSQKVIIK